MATILGVGGGVDLLDGSSRMVQPITTMYSDLCLISNVQSMLFQRCGLDTNKLESNVDTTNLASDISRWSENQMEIKLNSNSRLTIQMFLTC